MSRKKISELPAADPLDGSELFEVVQDGASKQTDGSALNTFIGGLVDLSVKQDINARSTLYDLPADLDTGINYTLQGTDKNKLFRANFTVSDRTFTIPAALPTTGADNILNIGASFKIYNRAVSTKNVNISAAGVTFEGTTTITPGQFAIITRIDTNIYSRS